MVRNSKNILRHELIGLNTEVVESSNPNYLGIKGKIVDETKKSIIINQQGTLKRILKNQVNICLKLSDNKVDVQGKFLEGRPWERLKKKLN